MRTLGALVGLCLAAGCGGVPCKGPTCTNAVDAGQSPPCSGGCSGALPVCDVARNVCVACTATQGCGGLAPVCDTSRPGGACVACTATAGCSGVSPYCFVDSWGRRCVQCRTSADCFSYETCDTGHRCRPTATLDGGEADGGAPAVDGGDAVDADDAGLDAGTPGGAVDAGVCPPRAPPAPCSLECPSGFRCLAGECVLNGALGPVQVTLRWNTDEDVDLHVLEPVAGGGACDVYYGNTNGSQCGARGMLDLDSNAACVIDHVGIENVIYDPDAGAPSGTYAVLVNHYANCSPATTWVPYEVEVRVGSTISGFCGAFTAGSPEWSTGGAANAGTQVMTFTVP